MVDTQIIGSGLLRQRERTVDNVKRLYAFVLSLSFTNILKEIFDTASDALLDPKLKHSGLDATMGLDFALLGVFLFTAAIYYFHSDKYLDIKYAMPIRDATGAGDGQVVVAEWRSGSFGWDYITLIMTMFPFAIMSFSLDKHLVGRFGIIPFYTTYIVLLQFSVGLIVISGFMKRVGDIPNCFAGRAEPDDESPLAYEERRYSALNLHWALIDTVAVLISQHIFWIDKKGGALCASLSTNAATWFVCLFLVVATARNLLDYVGVWPFLYLSDDRPGRISRRWIMSLLFRENLTVKGGSKTKMAVAALYALSVWVTWRQLYRQLPDILSLCP